MTTKRQAKPKTAVERWNRAVHEAYADDASPAVDPGAQAILDASPEEIERQLVAAGVDLAELDAKADATYEAAVAKFGAPFARPSRDMAAAEAASETDEPPSTGAWASSAVPRPSTIEPRPKTSRAMWIAYAAAAAATTGGVAYVAGHPSEEEPKKDEPVIQAPVPPKPGPPKPSATAAPTAPPDEPSKTPPSDDKKAR